MPVPDGFAILRNVHGKLRRMAQDPVPLARDIRRNMQDHQKSSFRAGRQGMKETLERLNPAGLGAYDHDVAIWQGRSFHRPSLRLPAGDG